MREIASLHPAKSLPDSARNDIVGQVSRTHACRLPHELQHEIALSHFCGQARNMLY
jgi:hypothetical protein